MLEIQYVAQKISFVEHNTFTDALHFATLYVWFKLSFVFK